MDRPLSDGLSRSRHPDTFVLLPLPALVRLQASLLFVELSARLAPF